MNVSLPNKGRKPHVWRYDVEHGVYDIACRAMEGRPDFDQIQALWSAVNDRFTFMRNDHSGTDGDLLYQMDLTELAGEAGIDDDTCLSHLWTMQGSGLFAAVVTYQEFNSVSVVVAPHMVAK